MTQAHGSVSEKLALLYFLVEYLRKDYLEGHGDTCLIKILLKHLCLLALLSCLIVNLNPLSYTSYSCSGCFLGLFEERGELFSSSFGSCCSDCLTSTFFGSSILIYYFLTSSFCGAAVGFGGIQIIIDYRSFSFIKRPYWLNKSNKIYIL